MANNKKQPKKTVARRERERPLIPPDEVPIDEDLEDGPEQPLNWETSLELLESIDDGEAVMAEIDDYATLPDVVEDFAERQELDTGAHLLRRRLREHHGETPDLSADDLD